MLSDDHDDHRHIVLSDLQAAAQASGITPAEAVSNIVDTLRDAGPQELFLAAFASTTKGSKKRRKRKA
jgi:hypothetical protein